MRATLLFAASAAKVGRWEGVKVPSWNTTIPDENKPLGGFEPVPGAQNVELCHGEITVGTYNHASMINYHDGQFFAAWKNGVNTEDKSNQRILYSQSTDGLVWTKVTNASSELFPSMTTKAREAAMFVGPPIHLNGRMYVGASPGGYAYCKCIL